MKKLLGIVVLGLLWCNTSFALPKCEGEDISKWTMCEGTKIFDDGLKYVGEFKDGLRHGLGIATNEHGSYSGEYKNGVQNGQGTMISHFRNSTMKYQGNFKERNKTFHSKQF